MTIRALRSIRWTMLGLIVLFILGIALLEFWPRPGLWGRDRSVADADNALAGTVSVPGFSVGGRFDLIDHKGRPVTEATFKGQWMLVFFGYTECPEDCPLTLQKMATALNALGPFADRIAPVFITVDPVRDTPDRLASYVANFGPRIIGLTGSNEHIAAAARAYRVYYSSAEHEQSGADLVSHSTFVYLNPSGKLDALLRPDSNADELAAALRARLSSQTQTARPG